MPVTLLCSGWNITVWSVTAYSTLQAWLIPQLTSISYGLSPFRHLGTRLVGEGHPTAELEVACPRVSVFNSDISGPHRGEDAKVFYHCYSMAASRSLILRPAFPGQVW